MHGDRHSLSLSCHLRSVAWPYVDRTTIDSTANFSGRGEADRRSRFAGQASERVRSERRDYAHTVLPVMERDCAVWHRCDRTLTHVLIRLHHAIDRLVRASDRATHPICVCRCRLPLVFTLLQLETCHHSTSRSQRTPLFFFALRPRSTPRRHCSIARSDRPADSLSARWLRPW
jgi:hypothetical protein